MSTNTKRRLVVMSVDAMVTEDVDKLREMPNFHRYMTGAAEIKRVRAVYPTITYPEHTSIATGVYPDRHGVIANSPPLFGWKGPIPWLWFHDAVKVPDIFTAAKKRGLSTAAVFWPVTGNHPDIDWLIDEYWTQGEGDTLREAFKRSGSTPEVLEIVDKYAPIMVERRHPQADDFVVSCACDIIERFKPELLMIHPANIDGYRHSYGLWGAEVDRGIAEADGWIGQLVRSMKIAGTYDETDFCVISDHGQIDIKRVVSLNTVFRREGLLKLDPDGNLLSWDAYMRSGGTSAWVYIKDKSDKALYDRVYGLLKSLRDDGVYGIGRVYTEEEAEKEERLSEDFSFVVETDGYTSFSERMDGPAAQSFDLSDYRFGRATHGHNPDKGPQPVFIGKGPSFKENASVERRPIVDEAAIFAKILGLDMPGIDGVAVDELLK